jgi:hypothetical protein
MPGKVLSGAHLGNDQSLGDLGLEDDDWDEDYALVNHLEHSRRLGVLTYRLRARGTRNV